MVKSRCLHLSLLFLVSSVAPLAAQNIEMFFINRGQAVFQTGPSEGLKLSDVSNFSFDWGFYLRAGAELNSGTLTSLSLQTPANLGTVAAAPEEPQSWEIDRGFDSAEFIASSAPAGTYTFTGEGSTAGAFNETLEIGAYNAVETKWITNYNDLLDIDPSAPLIIEWEPFSDATGVDGFISVEVSYWNGFSDIFIWSVDDTLPEGEWGLPVDAVSVTIPAGTLQGSPLGIYRVWIEFVRIDQMVPTQGFQESSQLIEATTSETVIEVATDRSGLAPLSFSEVGALDFGVTGAIFGVLPDWGFGFQIGYYSVEQTPSWIYHIRFGWLSVPARGDLALGLWFYSPKWGWIYIRTSWDGWCYNPERGWQHLRFPLYDWLN